MSEGAPLLRTAERLDTGNNIIWGTTFHIPPAPRDRILCACSACIIDPAHQPQLQQHAQPRLSPFVYLR